MTTRVVPMCLLFHLQKDLSITAYERTIRRAEVSPLSLADETTYEYAIRRVWSVCLRFFLFFLYKQPNTTPRRVVGLFLLSCVVAGTIVNITSRCAGAVVL